MRSIEDRPRLKSVDVFRGMTIVAMIVVNNPGNPATTYWPLKHAEWHGWTPTDLVFPFFLFIVGVAIVLALKRRVDGGAAKGPLLPKIVRRSVILFGLGLFLTGFPFGLFAPHGFGEFFATWRIPGVLQRIAVCYLVVSLLVLYCRIRTLKVLTISFLMGYWALMTLVPVPGQGAPNIDDPGGHLSAWIDRAVFGDHVWQYAKVYDPEGLLSTVPALATTLFGVFAGLLLVARCDPVEKVARLFVRGGLLVAIGFVWGWVLPSTNRSGQVPTRSSLPASHSVVSRCASGSSTFVTIRGPRYSSRSMASTRSLSMWAAGSWHERWQISRSTVNH
jgi:predicted acyltransferase